MRRTFPLVLRWLLCAAAAAAAIYALILARAEWLFERDTARSLPEAVALVPYNSTYLTRLAAWLPSKKIALLERAVKLNPFDYQSWIQLGYAAEFLQHDPAKAERDYRIASEVNKMYLPKWTLANFYYRHGRANDFFRWATAALAITPYAPEPLFTEMWQMSSDAERIARAIPDRPRTLLAYAWFLSNQNQIATIPEIVDRLIKLTGNRDPHAWGRDDLLAAIEDRLLAGGNVDPALRVWSTLSKAGWIPFGVPSQQKPVTNGDFRIPLYEHGFDWVRMPQDDIRIDASAVTGTLRIEFSGNESETGAELLREYIPLKPGGAYTLHWTVETELAETPSGLTWALRSVAADASHEEVQLQSPDVSAANTWSLHAPTGAKLGVLTLKYRRPLGHLRARGAVILKSVSARLH